MKLKIMDVIGIGIVAVGVVMTTLMFFATRNPIDIESFKLQEIPAPAPGESLPWPQPHDRPA
jgi:hypothetical protein